MPACGYVCRNSTIGAWCEESISGFLVRDAATPPHVVQRRQHHGKRPVGPALALAQPGDRVGVGGIDQQLKAAKPFMATIRPANSSLRRRVQGRVADGQFAALAVEQLQRRPATRTGDRLGMEPPVGRILVLRPALGAHRKRGHRGPRPVVGQPLDDRPPRPAIGAIGERIAVPPLRRIANLGQALAAGGQIGGNRRPRRRTALAGANLKG